jgi:signal transduction histidine kinase
VSTSGRHVFQARGFDIDGNVTDTVAEIEFRASYEWWRHPLTQFMGALLLLNMVAVAVLVVLRLKELRKNLSETQNRRENLEREVRARTSALRESEEKYRLLAFELEEAGHFKDRLMTNISHDFRTPLTSLIGYAELLASKVPGPLTPQQEEFLATILDNATRMENLLQNVTQIIADGGIEGQPLREFFDLQEVLWNSVKSHAFRARDRDIEIEILPEGEDFWIVGAKDLVGRLVDNLIWNAVKFSNNGGKVTVRITNEEAAVVLCVTDNGIGIGPDDIGRIFDRYYRADHGQRDYAGGLGIGLSICKEIADYHQATIEVESEPGKGSTFRVIWPDLKT